jgi:3-deoxy-manno-octulosonate cytidylyltransferase (CMP-KDO synthetase)
MKILGIIPARYASSRFPGKPLVYIDGKTMIHRVYDQVKLCPQITDVVVATDHYSIYEHVEQFGGKVMMTSDTHPSGTDRCSEVLLKLGDKKYDYVVNIQGDEPFIQPAQISLLCDTLLERPDIATLVKKIDTLETLYNPNTPKVIFDHQMNALYFSRHPIPYMRGVDADLWLAKHKYYKHIGIYAYQAQVLLKLTKLPMSALENAECLEQLRWLEEGLKIKIAVTEFDSFGIDTPQDLENLKHNL